MVDPTVVIILFAVVIQMRGYSGIVEVETSLKQEEQRQCEKSFHTRFYTI
jgi:hypothetical protein